MQCRPQFRAILDTFVATRLAKLPAQLTRIVRRLISATPTESVRQRRVMESHAHRRVSAPPARVSHPTKMTTGTDSESLPLQVSVGPILLLAEVSSAETVATRIPARTRDKPPFSQQPVPAAAMTSTATGLLPKSIPVRTRVRRAVLAATERSAVRRRDRWGGPLLLLHAEQRRSSSLNARRFNPDASLPAVERADSPVTSALLRSSSHVPKAACSVCFMCCR